MWLFLKKKSRFLILVVVLLASCDQTVEREHHKIIHQFNKPPQKLFLSQNFDDEGYRLPPSRPLDIPDRGRNILSINEEVETNIVFLGDSITHYGHYVSALENGIFVRWPDAPINFFNAGSGGDRVGWRIEDRLEADVLTHDPNLVVILIGMNDADYDLWNEVSMREFEQDFGKIVDQIQDYGADVLLMSTTWYDLEQRDRDNPDNSIYYEYARVLAEYSAQIGFLAYQKDVYYSNILHLMENITMKARANGETQFTLSMDGIHPNHLGGLIIARSLLKTLFGREKARILKLSCDYDQETTKTLTFKLPYPYHEDVLGSIVQDDFASHYDQTKVVADCLSHGSYLLKADDFIIGEFDRSELAHGIPLAQHRESPWGVRGRALIEASEARRLFIADEVRGPMVQAKRDAMPLERAEDRRALFMLAHQATEAARAEARALAASVQGLAAPIEVEFRLKRVE